ncbi:MAG: TetR family transcriptional regulator C-terminal domain-containing protein [Acidobacteria bacterium]|nr:TetR family transcriptional regulator C-terminal domain-containing protein [Acidobacteriota bacterium]MCB9396727.1 TetR family transcriptional regulator C-terminal domain-containing protein [Acidobacteriota bacterium]
MRFTTTKQDLLEKGLEIFMSKGYNHTGIQEVIEAVGVPKGSFYHHFKSKEEFGVQVLELYAKQSIEQMRQLFGNTAIAPLKRLRMFFEMGTQKMAEHDCKGGCLIGNLSQELGDSHPVFQAILNQKMQAMREPLRLCLEEAKSKGEIQSGFDATELADFMINSYQGALTRAKVEGCTSPLLLHRKMVFEGLLGVSAT